MKYESSLGVRRLLNRLIHIVNFFLPWGEKIWLIPVIRFQSDTEMEIIVLKYLDAIESERSSWLGNFNKDDPYFQTVQQRVLDLEARHGLRLEKYLLPYTQAGQHDVSQHEGHRLAVARYRANKNRRT